MDHFRRQEVQKYGIVSFYGLSNFIVGNWNAKVGSQETPGVTGKFGLGIRNEAGQRLIEFCQENALVIANTLFQQHKRRLYTWTSPDGQHRNQTDYVLCSQRWRSSIQSTKTRPGADCGSDGKASACNAGDLGWEDPLEKEMAVHSSILAWIIPWTEEPGRVAKSRTQTSDKTTKNMLIYFIKIYKISHILLLLLHESENGWIVLARWVEGKKRGYRAPGGPNWPDAPKGVKRLLFTKYSLLSLICMRRAYFPIDAGLGHVMYFGQWNVSSKEH